MGRTRAGAEADRVMKIKFADFMMYLGIILILGSVVLLFVTWVRSPELTQMQVILGTPDALAGIILGLLITGSGVWAEGR